MIKLNKYFIPYIIILFLLGFRGETLVSFSIVFLHEFVHYIVARFLGFSGFDVEILPIGAVLKVKDLDEATPKEDFIISISGPLFNLIMALIFYFTSYKLLFISNLAIGLLNFLPAIPLDGGRMLRDLFLGRTLYKRANKLTIYISYFVGYVLVFYNIALFYRGNINLNLAIIALFIIFCSYKEKERIVYIIMGDIIKKKLKIINRGYMENKSISIFYKKNLLYALSLVDKGRYNVFTILNENIEVIDIIYEQELVEALKKYGNISIDEFIKISEEDSSEFI